MKIDNKDNIEIDNSTIKDARKRQQIGKRELSQTTKKRQQIIKMQRQNQ